jgi:hypothetical protein
MEESYRNQLEYKCGGLENGKYEVESTHQSTEISLKP